MFSMEISEKALLCSKFRRFRRLFRLTTPKGLLHRSSRPSLPLLTDYFNESKRSSTITA
jgi:hypothetical protein